MTQVDEVRRFFDEHAGDPFRPRQVAAALPHIPQQRVAVICYRLFVQGFLDRDRDNSRNRTIYTHRKKATR